MKGLTGIIITNDFEGTVTITGFMATGPYAGQTGSIYITSSNGARPGGLSAVGDKLVGDGKGFSPGG